MMIQFRHTRNPLKRATSNIGFSDDYPHAATPLWADPAVTEYLLFAERDLWDHGGTVVSNNVAYTLVPERGDSIPLNCMMEAA